MAFALLYPMKSLFQFVFSILLSTQVFAAASTEGIKTFTLKGNTAKLIDLDKSCEETYYKKESFPLMGYSLGEGKGYSTHEIAYRAKSWHLFNTVEDRTFANGSLLKPLESGGALVQVVSNRIVEGSNLEMIGLGTDLILPEESLRPLFDQGLQIVKELDLGGLDLAVKDLSTKTLIWSLEIDGQEKIRSAVCGEGRQGVGFFNLVTKVDEENLRLLVPFGDGTSDSILSSLKVNWAAVEAGPGPVVQDEVDSLPEVKPDNAIGFRIDSRLDPLPVGVRSLPKELPALVEQIDTLPTIDKQNSVSVSTPVEIAVERNEPVTVPSHPRRRAVEIAIQEEEEKDEVITDNFANLIAKGLAEETARGVISFFNKRIDPEAVKRKLEDVRNIREGLLKSDDKFLCVNEDLSGYPETIGKGRVKLLRSTDKVFYVDGVDPVEEVKGNKITKFVFIEYQGKSYWARESVENTKSNTTDRYITTFEDCPKIQNDIEEVYLKELDAKREESVLQGITLRSAAFAKYVCTDDGDRLNASETKERKNEHKLRQGLDVSILQGSEHEPFEGDNGFEYIHVQSDGKQYWVARKFIKNYDDCPQIQTEPVQVCVKSKLNYYVTDEELSVGRASGEFEGLSSVYRFYGDVYDKKVVNNVKISGVVYVPVKKDLDSEAVFWVAEKYVPKECGLGVRRSGRFTYKSHKGATCMVQGEDNFPLTKKAQHDFYTSPAKYGNYRPGRSHAATDLYTYKAFSPQGNNRWGGKVYAIEDGKVMSTAKYSEKYSKRHIKRVTVQSLNGKHTWNYAEIGQLQVRKDQSISKGDLIGTTADFISGNKKYPAMLHLERYKKHIEAPRQGPLNHKYDRNSSIEDPSCYVEFLQRRKFGGNGYNDF